MTDTTQDFDEYAGLTDEEIAALKEIAEDDGEGDAGDGDSGEGGSGEGGLGDDEQTGKPAKAGAGQQDDDAGTAAAGDNPADAAVQAGGARAPEPLISAQAPADAEDRLNALAAQRLELMQKFETGDVEARDYAEALDKLDTERDDLRWELRKAKLSMEVSENQRAETWFNEVDAFLGDHAALKGNQAALVAFDALVRQVTGDKANAALTPRQQLDKAYAALTGTVAALGGGSPATARADVPPVKPVSTRKPLPPTLAHVPAAAASETDDGRFAALDRLSQTDPLRFEKEMARLSDAERESYLAFS